MAKFKQTDFNTALKNKFSDISGILFYGPDRGQVLENFNLTSDTIAPESDDGFSVFDFKAEDIKSDPSKLIDEATTISFLSTRKVIKIKDATNDIADTLKDLLKSSDKLEAFIIMSADELPPSSKLRTLFETNPKLAAFPSYTDEGENLSNIIRQTLVKNGIKRIPDEVLLYIRENLGENRATTRMELEKLCLYLHGKNEITIDDAINCIMDSSVLNMSDLPIFVAEGNNKKLSSTLTRLLNEGIYPVQLIRTVLHHFEHLYFMAGEIERGHTITSVIENSRPPIFFKLKPSYERQLKFWNTDKIIKIISRLNEAEIMCKTSNSPQDIILSQILFNICAFAHKKLP